MSTAKPTPHADFYLFCSGSIYLFCPLTDAAKAWLGEHCPADGEHQYVGPNLAVESRYIDDLVNNAVNDGLTPSPEILTPSNI